MKTSFYLEIIEHINLDKNKKMGLQIAVASLIFLAEEKLINENDVNIIFEKIKQNLDKSTKVCYKEKRLPIKGDVKTH